MTAYYYVKNGQKTGPETKAALKGKVTKDTLIWKEGMLDWVKASENSELNDLFIKEPPPIPKAKSKTQKEAPTVPDTEPRNKFLTDSIYLNAILLFILTLALGIIDFNGLGSGKIYGLLIIGSVITTYYLLKNIKTYLNEGLDYYAVNKDINILIVTSIILGVADKLFIKFEKKLDAMQSLETPILIVFLVVIIALILNWIYFFKLGKKLSKIEHKLASKISKFAYATAISYFLSIVTLIVLNEVTLIIVETFLMALPLVYLIFNFKETDTVIAQYD